MAVVHLYINQMHMIHTSSGNALTGILENCFAN